MPPKGRSLPIPSDEQIIAAVRARKSASIKELCGALWPGLRWLPDRTSFRCARTTLRRWPLCPPLPDGRSEWLASVAMWLYRACEVMVRQGRLEHAPVGETPIIDILTTTSYRVPTECRVTTVAPRRRQRLT